MHALAGIEHVVNRVTAPRQPYRALRDAHFAAGAAEAQRLPGRQSQGACPVRPESRFHHQSLLPRKPQNALAPRNHRLREASSPMKSRPCIDALSA
jgi:hypothetical protein